PGEDPATNVPSDRTRPPLPSSLQRTASGSTATDCPSRVVVFTDSCSLAPAATLGLGGLMRTASTDPTTRMETVERTSATATLTCTIPGASAVSVPC